jgi:hypothetical protein
VGPICVLGEAMAMAVQRHESVVGCRLPYWGRFVDLMDGYILYIRAQGKVEQEESLPC